MAGIGFALRKAIDSDSASRRFMGRMGAAFSSSGVMLLTMGLFILVQVVVRKTCADPARSEMLCKTCMSYLTTTMLLSLMVTNIFSLVLSRYMADMIYIRKPGRIMPAFLGAATCSNLLILAVMVTIVTVSKLEVAIAAILVFLSLALSTCWLLMTSISLLRDYRRIIHAYLLGIAVACVLLFFFSRKGEMTVFHMLLILTAAFTVTDILLFRALYISFHRTEGSVFAFLTVARKSPALLLTGLLLTLGMGGHFLVVWFFSPTSVTIAPLFRFNAEYDLPAILPFFSTIPASVVFLTGFEPSFSESYHDYFQKLGTSGTLKELEETKAGMVNALGQGFFNIALVQLIFCVLFMTVGAKWAENFNLCSNILMLNTFRMFSVGYSLYYLGNTLVLLQMYYENEARAMIGAALFALIALVGTYREIGMSLSANGISFILAGFVLLLVAGLQMSVYLERIEFHILCRKRD